MTILRKLNDSPLLTFYTIDDTEPLELPLFDSGVSAGFPSPADDFIEIKLDLNKYLIQHPSATFYGRVNGESMIDDGIHDGDILIIDRAMEPRNGDIVVSVLDGEFTVKRLMIDKESMFLQPANKKYPVVEVSERENFQIWGVVVSIVKKLR